MLAAGLCAWWFYHGKLDGEDPQPVGADIGRPSAAPVRKIADIGVPAVLPPDEGSLQKVSSHPDAVSFGSGGVPPEREAEELLRLFQVFRQHFGGFPTGEDNAQMMNALCGANPTNLPIFPLNHARFDSKRALLDAWGKPFVFHSVSRDLLEIRSCGRDGEIFTDDDHVAPPARK